MIKTICDFCEKEVPTTIIPRIAESNFRISKNGRYLDICESCTKSLYEWMESRKKEVIRDDYLTGKEVKELLESRKPYYQICKETAERM